MSPFFDKILESSDSGLLRGIGRRLLDTVTDAPKHLEAALGSRPILEIGQSDHGSHQSESDLMKQLETSLHFGHEFGELDLEKFLQSVNKSQEVACLMRAAAAQPERYCPVYWDEVMCWPHTAPGTTAVLKCFEEFEGIKYDSSQNATRYCTPAGLWDNYTDYSRCRERGELASAGEGGTSTLLTSHLYLAGYSLSLAALLLAVGVFVYFKDLRCLRNTIHTNLMCTYILFGFIWILNLALQMSVQRDNISCLALMVFFHYFYLTNFFWMLVEGLYLYMLVVKTFTGENIKLRVYASIGWGAPAVFVTLWTFVRVFVPVETGAAELKELAGMPNVCQFMQEHPCDWIYKGPAMAGLALNLLFLIRIMWVLITKLRSANTLETQQYRKATKALLVLIPLLGITYLLVLYGPSNGYSAELFDYARAILLSTQGFTVALFYCFLNTEVQNAMRHHLERWQAKRSVGGGRRYHYNYTKDWSPRSRTESIRLYSQPTNIYHKRESTASETTTTTLVGFPVGNKGQMVTRPPNSISPKLLQPYNSTTIENTIV